MALWLLYSFNI